MTAVAVARRPLVAVLVAAEAARHRGQERLRVILGDLHVTTHTLAVRRCDVLAVLEAQLLPRELHAAPHVRLAVAAAARPLVVRLRVAPPAIGVRGEMEGPAIARGLDALVAFLAVDPAVDVRAVLEGMRRRGAVKSEDARARRERQREDHEEREARPHRGPANGSNVRATRTSASVS